MDVYLKFKKRIQGPYQTSAMLISLQKQLTAYIY